MTVKLTTIELVTAPLVPVIITGVSVALVTHAVVWITSVLEVAEFAVKLHVAPDGKPLGQLNVTVPLKPFCGVIVIVLLLLFPPEFALRVAVLAESENPACVAWAFQAMARLSASTEPRPVTRL